MNDYHELIARRVVEQSNQLGRLIDYVEVGVLTGNSADAVLSTCKVRNAILIDDWSLQTPPTSKAQVEQRLEKYAGLFLLLVGDSKTILSKLTERFDVGFVDGDHSVEGCKSDMEKMLPLLREDGILFVHDLANPDFPKLKEVVVNFSEENGLAVKLYPDVMNGLGELTRELMLCQK
jgi:hypothetical protein